MQEMLDRITQDLVGYVPNLLGAIAILIVGWLAAWIISAIVRKLLHKTTVDNRVAETIAGKERAKAIPIEVWVSKTVFYLIMIFVLIAFFQALKLELLTEPLNRLLSQVFEYAPRIVGATILLAVAWVLANLLRMVLTRLLGAAKLEEKLGPKVGAEEGRAVSLTKPLADTAYWLVFLLFLPAILDVLALEGPLDPVKEMFNRILGFLPNILAAALILLIGWFIARIVRQIVTNLLVAVGTEQLSERIGVAKVLGRQKLSGVLGLIVYIFILIPVLIAALNALAMEAITAPASEMLDRILTMLPGIFGAALVLAIAYVVGRVVSELVANLLAGIGFNGILARLGIGKEPAEGQRTPSQVVGYVVLVAVILFASIEAAELLGFEKLGEIIDDFLRFAAQVLLGVVIFGLGLFLANIVGKAVRESGAPQASLLPPRRRWRLSFWQPRWRCVRCNSKVKSSISPSDCSWAVSHWPSRWLSASADATWRRKCWSSGGIH